MALKVNPIISNDSYKLSHFDQVPGECTQIYSHLTPRFVKYLKAKFPTMEDKVIVFGIQMTIKVLQERWQEGFFDLPWEKISEKTLKVLTGFIGYTEQDLDRFKKLHELGYLPLKFKALPEGSWVNKNIPVLIVTNTHKDFYWLPNFMEPPILNTIYKPMTVATLSLELARLRDKYFDLTVEDQSGKDFALHDFSYRGQSGHESAAQTIAAYLLYTKGTDTIAGIEAAQYYYGAGSDIAGSIPAFEHSTATLGIQYYKGILDKFYAVPGADVKVAGDKVIAETTLEKDKDGNDIPLTEEQIHEIYFIERAKLLHATLKKITLKAVTEGLRAAIWVDLHMVNKPEKQRKLAIGEVFNLARVLIDVYPNGLFAYVSDSYNYNRVVSLIVPALKNIILAREGKFVVRPDSSDPVEIVNGVPVSSIEDEAAKEVLTLDIGESFRFRGQVFTKVKQPSVHEGTFLPFFLLERNGFIVSVADAAEMKARVIASEALGSIRTLAEVFGTTTNAKGYKQLPPQIGLVYGDGMNYDRIDRIYNGLKENGFAASNVVLSGGAYMLANLTRDDLGFAIKASYAEVDGEGYEVYKEPETDMSKASAAGLFKVVKEESGDYKLFAGVSPQQEEEGELQTIWIDGQFVKETTFAEIQARLPL